jgi:hypothetical protein
MGFPVQEIATLNVGSRTPEFKAREVERHRKSACRKDVSVDCTHRDS